MIGSRSTSDKEPFGCLVALRAAAGLEVVLLDPTVSDEFSLFTKGLRSAGFFATGAGAAEVGVAVFVVADLALVDRVVGGATVAAGFARVEVRVAVGGFVAIDDGYWCRDKVILKAQSRTRGKQPRDVNSTRHRR